MMSTPFPTVSRSFSTGDSVSFSVMCERSRTREGQTQTLFAEVGVSIVFQTRTGVTDSHSRGGWSSPEKRVRVCTSRPREEDETCDDVDFDEDTTTSDPVRSVSQRTDPDTHH